VFAPLRVRLLKHRVPLAVLGIFLAGLVAGRWGYGDARRDLLTELTREAERCAAAFDAAELAQLAGTPAEVGTPAYEAIKHRLTRFQSVDASVRFTYVFRRLPDGVGVIFLADSEPAGSPHISLPGDVYEPAAQSPGLQETLRTGRPATEGPLADEFGTWVTGYAAIPASDGTVREVLGLDISARSWHRRLWGAGLQTAVYVWILFGLPLAGYVFTRRQQEQNEVIRNLSEAMEQSHSAVMIVDLQSRIEYLNAGLSRQIGYPRRELIGRPWRNYQSPAMAPEMAAELVTTVRAGQTWSGEWMNLRRDGSFYPVRGTVTPVKRRNGELACFVAVFDDMTEVKRNEAVLREALVRAEAGDRAKSQFLATMSHEVRTPLNGIVGFTNLLLETPLSAEQQEYLQTIRLSAEAIIGLTSDMLDFARIESGKFKLDLQPCNPRECLEDALDLLAARAAEKKLELLHHVDATVPAAVVSDPGRLRQVLINLIGNAVKFTDRGEVEVTLSARALAAGEGAGAESGGPVWELQFSVRDTGLGIAAEQQAQLFKPFSQIESSSTRRFGGTGLGLAICRNLVQLMGGQITLESTPGTGSTFSFTVRVTEVESEFSVTPASLAGLRLAVAGPSASLRRELLRLGGEWGAEVIDAVEAELPALTWDVALIDLDLAGATRLAALPEARTGLPRDKVIGLVPLVLPASIRSALRTHFRILVNKPVHHDALRSQMLAPVPARDPVGETPVKVEDNLALRVLLVEDNPVNQRLMQRVLTNLGCQWAVADNGRLALEELARADYDIVLMDLHMPEMDGMTAIAEIRRGAAGCGSRRSRPMRAMTNANARRRPGPTII
jgi:PAS domain S-box-containing protein